MPASATTFAAIIAAGILFLILAWISHRISLLIQQNVYLLSGSMDFAMVILFLIYLPGILIHEGAHWLMAKSLGLKTGNFRVWPRKQAGYIGLGSVSVSSGGTLADSLVGMAPLLVGSVLVALIGTQIFDTHQIGRVWQEDTWLAGVHATTLALFSQKDGLLWSYLLFAIANAMVPSSSDRQPLKSLLLYVLALGGLYLLLDQSGQLFLRVANWLVEPIQLLAGALLFTLVVDVTILTVLYVMQVTLIGLRSKIGQL